MSANDARVECLPTYHIPANLVHGLNRAEAAACLLDPKAGCLWSGEAVDHYGGTRKVVIDVWTYRKAAHLLDGLSTKLERAPDVSETGTRSHALRGDRRQTC